MWKWDYFWTETFSPNCESTFAIFCPIAYKMYKNCYSKHILHCPALINNASAHEITVLAQIPSDRGPRRGYVFCRGQHQSEAANLAEVEARFDDVGWLYVGGVRKGWVRMMVISTGQLSRLPHRAYCLSTAYKTDWCDQVITPLLRHWIFWCNRDMAWYMHLSARLCKIRYRTSTTKSYHTYLTYLWLKRGYI